MYESIATCAARAFISTRVNATNHVSNLIGAHENGASIFPVSGDELARTKAGVEAYDEPTFESNRWEGVTYPYRDDEDYKVTSFAELLARSASMISDSYGWAPNRAARIYYEAYAENETFDGPPRWENADDFDGPEDYAQAVQNWEDDHNTDGPTGWGR